MYLFASPWNYFSSYTCWYTFLVFVVRLACACVICCETISQFNRRGDDVLCYTRTCKILIPKTFRFRKACQCTLLYYLLFCILSFLNTSFSLCCWRDLFVLTLWLSCALCIIASDGEFWLRSCVKHSYYGYYYYLLISMCVCISWRRAQKHKVEIIRFVSTSMYDLM